MDNHALFVVVFFFFFFFFFCFVYFLEKRQNLKLSSVANNRWRFKGLKKRQQADIQRT